VGEEEEDGRKSEPPKTILSTVEGINTVRKYLTKFDTNINMMVALSSIENVYRVQQKAKKQELT
jgi:hypothetical protein